MKAQGWGLLVLGSFLILDLCCKCKAKSSAVFFCICQQGQIPAISQGWTLVFKGIGHMDSLPDGWSVKFNWPLISGHRISDAGITSPRELQRGQGTRERPSYLVLLSYHSCRHLFTSLFLQAISPNTNPVIWEVWGSALWCEIPFKLKLPLKIMAKSFEKSLSL